MNCLNLDFDTGEWKTRSGLSPSITLGYGGAVRRYSNFFNATAGVVTLVLDDSGNLYTFSSRSGDTATTPRLTVAGATDFSTIQFFGKIYIAFHDGQTGLSGVNLKVFIPGATVGSDEFRDAAGLAPSAAGAIVAADGAAGLVNAGVYKIAVAYITTSGHYTVPGPKVGGTFTPTTYTASGSKKINLSNIPTGPAGTAKRQIIITQAGLEEYFFIASAYGGVINDNTTTTAVLNFDDITDLVSSADYLFDQLETIPTPLELAQYSGRLVTLGEKGNDSILRVSKAGEPESFDSVDGIIVVTKDDGFVMRNAVELRGTLYLAKNLGVMATSDNGDVPSSWPVYVIDRSINIPVHGISEFFDLSGIRIARDFLLVVDRSGILLFDGAFRKPPITHKIDDIWQSINFAQYHKIVLVVDEQNHKIYCAIPTGAATDNNKLLMGDYNSCPGLLPDSRGIKWSLWEFKPGGAVKNPTEIGLIAVVPDTVPTLKIGSIDGGGKIWKLDPSVTTDDGTVIESYFETALIFFEPGNVHFFTAARMRVTGSGTLLITIRGEDSVLSASLPSTILASAPGAEVLVRFNFQNEKAAIKFRLTSGNFIMSKLELFGKPVYSMRPA